MVLKYGMAAGILLLALVTAISIALGARAARSVARSRGSGPRETEE